MEEEKGPAGERNKQARSGYMVMWSSKRPRLPMAQSLRRIRNASQKTKGGASSSVLWVNLRYALSMSHVGSNFNTEISEVDFATVP